MARKYLAKPVGIAMLIGIFIPAAFGIVGSKSADNKELQVTVSLPESVKKISLSLEEPLCIMPLGVR